MLAKQRQDASFETFAVLIAVLSEHHSSAKTALDKLLVSIQQLVKGQVSITHVRIELEQLLRALTSSVNQANNDTSTVSKHCVHTSSENQSNEGKTNSNRPTTTSPQCNTSSSAYSSDCSPLSSLVECTSLCPLSGSISSSSLTIDANKSTSHCQTTANQHNGSSNASNPGNVASANNCNSVVPPPPPPPPPSSSITSALLCNQISSKNAPSSSNNSSILSNQTINNAVNQLLPDTPKPRARMKTLNWSKIPAQKILCNTNNIWNHLLLNHQSFVSQQSMQHQQADICLNKSKNALPLDFETLERLFCQNTANTNTNLSGSAPNSCPNSPRTSRRLAANSSLNNGNGNALSTIASNGYSSNNCSTNITNNNYVNCWNSPFAINSLSNSNSSASVTSGVLGSNKSSVWSNNGVATGHMSAHNGTNSNFGQIKNAHTSSTIHGSFNTDAHDFKSQCSYASLEHRLVRSTTEHRDLNEVPNVLAQLLDTQKSLNVSIFLKQFRNEQQVLNAIRSGDAAQLGAERLVHLLRLFPDQDEIQMLCSIDDLCRLPCAERFLVKLIAIPSSRLRIECMLLKEEFESNFSHVRPSLDKLIEAGKEIQQCDKLHQVFLTNGGGCLHVAHLLLFANFTEQGGYAGDAAGFKMLSLLKLSEIRANKPGMSLIHFVALEASKHDLVPLQLDAVEQASRISVDTLKSDINSLANKIFKLKQQLNSGKWPVHVLQPCLLAQLPSDEPLNEQFFDHMAEFLVHTETQVKQLTQKMETDLEQIRKQLGEFLCEDLSEFKLEDCFRIFSCFLNRLRSAQEENERRKESELRQEQRRLSGSRVSLNQTDKHYTNGSSMSYYSSTLDSESRRNDHDWTSVNDTHSLPRNKRSYLKNGYRHTNNSEHQMDSQLLELLNQSTAVGQSAENLFFAGGSFRRLGSTRKSCNVRNNNASSAANVKSKNKMLSHTENDRERKDNGPLTIASSCLDVSSNSCASLDFEQNDFAHKKAKANQDEDHQADSFDRFARMRQSIRASPLASPTGSKTTLRISNHSSTGNLATPTNETSINHSNNLLDSISSSMNSTTGTCNNGGSTNNLMMMMSSRLATSSHHSSQLSIGTVIAAGNSAKNSNPISNSDINIYNQCTSKCNSNDNSNSNCSSFKSQTDALKIQRQSTFVGGSLLTGLKNSLAQLLPKDSKENCHKQPKLPSSLKHVKAKVHSIRSNSNGGINEHKSLMDNYCASKSNSSLRSERASSCKAPETRNRFKSNVMKCDASSMSQLDGQMRLQLQNLAPATRTTLNRTSLLRMSLNSRLNNNSSANPSNMTNFNTFGRASRSSIRRAV